MYSDQEGESRRRAALDRKIQAIQELDNLIIEIRYLWEQPITEASYIKLLGLVKNLESTAFRAWANLYNTSDDRIGILLEAINEFRVSITTGDSDNGGT